MSKHYVLSADDLALVRAKRRAINRLGFSIQLCLLRYPGQGLRPGEHPPEAMIGFVAHQLGASPAAFTDYALRDQTRREHAVELQEHLHLRGFRLADWRACLQVGTGHGPRRTDRSSPPPCGSSKAPRAPPLASPKSPAPEAVRLSCKISPLQQYRCFWLIKAASSFEQIVQRSPCLRFFRLLKMTTRAERSMLRRVISRASEIRQPV
jgi:hypothetical protein